MWHSTYTRWSQIVLSCAFMITILIGMQLSTVPARAQFCGTNTVYYPTYSCEDEQVLDESTGQVHTVYSCVYHPNTAYTQSCVSGGPGGCGFYYHAEYDCVATSNGCNIQVDSVPHTCAFVNPQPSPSPSPTPPPSTCDAGSFCVSGSSICPGWLDTGSGTCTGGVCCKEKTGGGTAACITDGSTTDSRCLGQPEGSLQNVYANGPDSPPTGYCQCTGAPTCSCVPYTPPPPSNCSIQVVDASYAPNVCGTLLVRVRVNSEPSDNQVDYFKFKVSNSRGAVNPDVVRRIYNVGPVTNAVLTGLSEGNLTLTVQGFLDNDITRVRASTTYDCQTSVNVSVQPRAATPPAAHPPMAWNPEDLYGSDGKMFANGKLNSIVIPYDSSVVLSWMYKNGGTCNIYQQCVTGPCQPFTWNGYNMTALNSVSAGSGGVGGSLALHHVTGSAIYYYYCTGIPQLGAGFQAFSRQVIVNATDPVGQPNANAVSCYAYCHPNEVVYGAWNGTCDGTRTEISRSVTTWANCASTTTTETQSCLSTIQGQVFDATGFLACPATAEKNANALANVNVDLISLANGQHYSVTTDGSGNFSTEVIGGNTYRFSLAGSGGYDFSTPTMYCNATTAVAPTIYVAPNTSYGYPQIGVQTTADPWWQVAGGPVKALGLSGTVLRSLIPSTCLAPGCQPYLIRNLNGDDTDGYILTGGGNIDVMSDVGTQDDSIDQNGHNWLAAFNDVPDPEDYQYFYTLLDLPSNPVSDFDASANNAAKPTGDFDNDGAKAYFHNGDLTIGQEWNVDADEQIIVMVAGNVAVNQEIHVAQGGFLMIVAQGNITFDEELGQADPASTTPVVEGVFVADGQILLPSRGAAAGGDLKFVGQGTFVGWSGFSLQRDYADNGSHNVYNNTNPVEFFQYRPDFLLYAPESLLRSRYSWREINP